MAFREEVHRGTTNVIHRRHDGSQVAHTLFIDFPRPAGANETPVDKRGGGSLRESSRKKPVFLYDGEVEAIERISATVWSDSFFLRTRKFISVSEQYIKVHIHIHGLYMNPSI